MKDRKLLVSVFNEQETREAIVGGGRIIDLSKGAAEALGAHRHGVVPVRVRRVEPSDEDRARLRKGKPAAALAPLPPRELAALRARLAAGER